MLPLLFTVLAMPDVQTTRVHLVIESPTRRFELIRQQRQGSSYIPDMLAAETVCREECDLDVEVDPRLDYVLNVVGFRYAVDMTVHGESLVLRVDPPSEYRFTASKVMIPVGLVGSIASSIVGIVSAIVWASRSAYALYPTTILGADPAYFALGGAAGFGVGVVTFVIGVLLRRTAAIDVLAMPGTVSPSNLLPAPPEAPQGPIQM